MKLATYEVPGTEPRGGIIQGDGVIDVERATDGRLRGPLDEILQAEHWRSELAGVGDDAPIAHPLSDVRLHPPLLRPGKILAAASNYQSHIDEGSGGWVDPARRVPWLFSKPSTTLIGPDETLPLPSISDAVDWELELAIVIGVPGRNIALEDALQHVAGYTIVNDISARSMNWDIEDRQPHNWNGFMDWLAGKWIDGFAPMGPWMVTSDEIADPMSLQLRLELNGELWQDSSTAGMIFGCRELVSFASKLMTLKPGDVICTGTPAGVGHPKGRYLRPGDVMVGTIEGIGSLTTPVEGADS